MATATIIVIERTCADAAVALDVLHGAWEQLRRRAEGDHLGVLSFGTRTVEHLHLVPVASIRPAQLTCAWSTCAGTAPPAARPALRLALARLTCAPRGMNRRVVLVSSGVVADERGVAVLVPSFLDCRVGVYVVTAPVHARVLADFAAMTGGELIPALHLSSFPSVLATLISSKEASHGA